MRFEYTPYSGNWLPLVPVAFGVGDKRLPAVGALVDTGATHTILPLEIAPELGIEMDLIDRVESQVAGGGQCFIYPSPAPIEYIILDPANGQESRWKGQVFFAPEQSLVLLGHHQCLERFDITFFGRQKQLELLPHGRNSSGERKTRR